MKMQIVFFICFSLTAAVLMAAQTKTVTNADLSKYSQERVKAEKDLRENYAKLGFSSPEEIELRNKSDAKDRAELSARLRLVELERERVEAERYAAARIADAYSRSTQMEIVTDNGSTGYFWSYGRRYRIPAAHGAYQQPGYFAGGQFWPTGSRTRPQPPSVWIRPRH